MRSKPNAHLATLLLILLLVPLLPISVTCLYHLIAVIPEAVKFQNPTRDNVIAFTALSLITLVTVPFTAIAIIVLYALSAHLNHVRKLCATGLETPGRILDKRIITPQNRPPFPFFFRNYANGIITGYLTTYAVTHTFVDPNSGKQLTAETSLEKHDWEAASIDQPVTVLYDPANTARSLPYEFSNYAIL